MASSGRYMPTIRRVLIWGLAGYGALIGLLVVPFFQRHVTYRHSIRLPFFAMYDRPELYGLAPLKTLNLKIRTTDGIDIGAWYIMSDLLTRPTVLLLHGAVGGRAMGYRVNSYSQMTSRLDVNILAVEYRGFGDSQGFPDEKGLYLDAQAAWDWLIERGAEQHSIIVMSHSLGTGVATKLVSQLEEARVSPKALVLIAPYVSVLKMLESFEVLGLPMLYPIQKFPVALKLFSLFISTRFNTVDLIAKLRTPIVIVHAKDDAEVPFWHGESLFATISESIDPELLLIHDIGSGHEKDLFGTITSLRDPVWEREAVFFALEKGGHIDIVHWEGVIDVIGEVVRLNEGVVRSAP